MKKFIGYFLIGIASSVLASCDIGLNMWQWWVIVLGFIIGAKMTHWE